MKFKHLTATILLFCLSAIGQTKTNIAILQLDPIEISAQEAQILTKKLSSEMVKLGIYTVLDRGEMEAILQEQGFQQTGCTSSECAVEVGQLLGVEKMVAGSVGKLGSIYYTEVRLIDVQSSKIDKTVDHNQEGSIEKVLTVSLPYIASVLSNIDITEPKNATTDTTLFIAAVTQKATDTVITPVVTEPAKPRELELVAHHNKGIIFKNGIEIGRDDVTITPSDETVVLTEKKFFYTSKPDTINLSTIKKSTYGVGGKHKEAVLSAGFFSARNGTSIFPAVRLSAGGIKQSASTHEVSVILGDMSAFSTFNDTPDRSTLKKEVSAVAGGFYEWTYDLEFGEFLKTGIGTSIGALVVREQNFNRFIGDLLLGNDPILPNPDIRHDITAFTLGGPKARVAFGYKRIFLESLVYFQMGVVREQHLIARWPETGTFASETKGKWEVIEDSRIDKLNPKTNFSVLPMVSFNIMLTL